MTIKINDGMAYNSGDDPFRSIVFTSEGECTDEICKIGAEQTVEYMEKNVSARYMEALYMELNELFGDE